MRVFLQRFSSFLFFASLQKRKEAKVKPQTYKRIKTDLNTKWQIMKCTYRDRSAAKVQDFPKTRVAPGPNPLLLITSACGVGLLKL